ncbi:MAG: Hsp70 family protein, partial [Acidimicrobiales bacterium]
FQLVDLPPAPRGVPQIEVTFDIDANGIVHVSAKDRATSKEQSMTITGQSSLGKFQLVDLPPAPRGIPQIEVTFDIDANGIVHVSAQDKATGKEQSMTITGQSSLAKDDIERMVRDAEAHAEDDRQRREEAEVRNSADTLVYQTEKLLKEQGEKFEGSEKDDVEHALQGLKDALAGTNVEAIKDATEKLVGVSQSFSQRLYEQASASAGGATADGGAAGESGEAGSDEDVVDAEIVDEQ